MKYLTLILSVFFCNLAQSSCEQNVDQIKTHYINGMFTDSVGFILNKSAIKQFIQAYLIQKGFSSEVTGNHNASEFFVSQIFEVGKHKWEDDEAADAIIDFLNGEHRFLTNRPQIEKLGLQSFLQDISNEYQQTLNEGTSIFGLYALKELLDTCSRVILITHSQGNFYGNAIITEMYNSYKFPNKYELFNYPMLGHMQLASPVDIPGGPIASVYPNVTGHITNSEDVVMSLVRSTFNSVSANFQSQVHNIDKSGHGLVDSYLNGQDGQPLEIAKQLTAISVNLIPYPMHPQHNASSSAIYQFGYSNLNELLDIKFHNDSVYRYNNVASSIYNGLLTAASQGTYFNSAIRNQHAFTKLE
ncbi:KTSC domain-containing protein [Catenovulum adriaticum]|uniref:KTSC domain-containing protein n=1 Tax=Catenovulum adriaticum TaxID=2984846 RepID=A0ABY7AL01_9ALTE|nr:KTSC domain-containing protein [Catenovulum sp. TS8]WAJ70198.1 KTSC domain-containing protein [Catenovulum sp. TS8]